jgi:hypothetical protein
MAPPIGSGSFGGPAPHRARGEVRFLMFAASLRAGSPSERHSLLLSASTSMVSGNRVL